MAVAPFFYWGRFLCSVTMASAAFRGLRCWNENRRVRNTVYNDIGSLWRNRCYDVVMASCFDIGKCFSDRLFSLIS